MAAAPRHCIKQEDVDYYIKCLALERGCPVEQVNRTKAHWDLIIYKEIAWLKLWNTERPGESTVAPCVVASSLTGAIGIDIGEM